MLTINDTTCTVRDNSPSCLPLIIRLLRLMAHKRQWMEQTWGPVATVNCCMLASNGSRLLASGCSACAFAERPMRLLYCATGRALVCTRESTAAVLSRVDGPRHIKREGMKRRRMYCIWKYSTLYRTGLYYILKLNRVDGEAADREAARLSTAGLSQPPP